MNPAEATKGVLGSQSVRDRTDKPAPKNTVLYATPIKLYAVVYGDSEGIERKGLAVVDGEGVVYLAPNGSDWVDRLGSVFDWFKRQFLTKIPSSIEDKKQSAPPKTDVPL